MTSAPADRIASTTVGVTPPVQVPVEPASGQGRKHGTSSGQAFDRWFRYPAGFASDYVTLLLERLELARGATVLDCFAGSGVTGTAARTQGMGFAGIEAHPMMAELANLKLAAGPDPTSVRQAATDVVARAHRSMSRRLATTTARWFADEPDLVQRSFTGSVLEELLTLRRFVQQLDERSDERAPYLKWALLATLRDVAAVKVGWPYQQPGVVRIPRWKSAAERFEQRVRWIAEDLAAHDARMSRGFVVRGDAGTASTWSAIGSADGCVSSPPYLNNFDYADATRLEAYFWGEVTSWAELCSTIRGDMLTATTQQSSTRASDLALETMSGSCIGEPVRELTAELAAARRTRTRGKEYDQVLPAYFLAMSSVLSNLADTLPANAPCVWLIGDSAPYGVYVDTPHLIGRLAEAAGFLVEDDVVLRHRGLRWRSAHGRHDVALAERLLVFRRRKAAVTGRRRSSGR